MKRVQVSKSLYPLMLMTKGSICLSMSEALSCSFSIRYRLSNALDLDLAD